MGFRWRQSKGSSTQEAINKSEEHALLLKTS